MFTWSPPPPPSPNFIMLSFVLYSFLWEDIRSEHCEWSVEGAETQREKAHYVTLDLISSLLGCSLSNYKMMIFPPKTTKDSSWKLFFLSVHEFMFKTANAPSAPSWLGKTDNCWSKFLACFSRTMHWHESKLARTWPLTVLSAAPSCHCMECRKKFHAWKNHV